MTITTASPALLPISDVECQAIWADQVYDTYCRQGLGEYLPERYFLELHHAADLASSGITPRQSAAAGIVSVGPLYLEKLGLPCRESLLVFFYLDPWGTPYTRLGDDGAEIPFCRARLNKPVAGQKYTQAKGSGIYPYFPQVPQGHTPGWRNWGVSAALIDEQENSIRPYPTTNALLTEGEKKALKATLEGYPTIGLGGVWNFKGAWGDVNKDLGTIVSRLRSLTLIYDNDCSTKPQVIHAGNALIQGLVDGQFSKAQQEQDDKANLKNIRDAIANGRPSTPSAPRVPLESRLFWSLLPHTLDGDKIGLDDLLKHPQGSRILQRLLDCRLPAVAMIEEGKDKEGNPKKTSTHTTYTAEPAGDDWLCKLLPQHGQEHLRRTLTEGAMILSNIMPVQSGHPYKWDKSRRIWRQMSREEWDAFPLAIADRHRWFNRRQALIGTCSAELLKHAQPREQFNPKMLVGFANGDYDPQTGQLLPIRPEHLLLNRIDVEWVPGAGCSHFLAWLDWMWSKPSLAHQVKLFQAALRWTLEPKRADKKFGAYSNSVEAIFGLVGPAGRGKGSLLEVLLNLLGENAVRSFSLGDSANPNALAKLVGCQACIDTDQKGHLNELTIGALNKLASNEPLEIKILYKDISQARLGTVAWFAANRIPQTPSNVEDNEGWQRRFVPFICERKPESRQSAFLERILRELPGIVQWAWDMPVAEATTLIREMQEADPDPELVQEELECHTIYCWLQETLATLTDKDIADSYVADAVSLTLLNEAVPVKDGALFAKTMKQLHGHYLYWCELNRERKPYGARRFGEQLRLLGATAVVIGEHRNRCIRLPLTTIPWDSLITGG